MKRITAAACALLLCFGLSWIGRSFLPEDLSVAETSVYRIMEEDENMILQFYGADKNNSASSNLQGSTFLKLPTFENIADMKNRITTGNIKAEELAGLRSFANKQGQIKICDLNSLKNAEFPEDVVLSHICWRGAEYSFEFSSKWGVGYIECITRESYEKTEFPSHTEVTLADGAAILSEELLPERNATATYYEYGGNRYTKILYTINAGDRTIHIKESYDGWASSASVPHNISFCGEAAGAYYSGWILVNSTERPSVEWLSSFGLTPYVEE